MTWLETLVAHLKQFEGLRLRAYDDFNPSKDITEISQIKGTLTIAFGHTGADVFPNMVISEAEAERLLSVDVEKFAAGVARLVDMPLADNERVALVSFAYNVGLEAFQDSTLLELLNAGDRAGAAAEFPKWRKSKGEIMPGLVRRRAAERTLFLSKGDEIMADSANVFVTKSFWLPIIGGAIAWVATQVQSFVELTPDMETAVTGIVVAIIIALVRRITNRPAHFNAAGDDGMT